MNILETETQPPIDALVEPLSHERTVAPTLEALQSLMPAGIRLIELAPGLLAAGPALPTGPFELVDEGYSWSADGERYDGHYPSRAAALAAARAYYGDDPDAPMEVFTARNKEHTPDFDYAAETALETLVCGAEDVCGEVVEDWAVARAEVNKAVSAALGTIVMHMEPPFFWTVDDEQKHTLNHEKKWRQINGMLHIRTIAAVHAVIRRYDDLWQLDKEILDLEYRKAEAIRENNLTLLLQPKIAANIAANGHAVEWVFCASNGLFVIRRTDGTREAVTSIERSARKNAQAFSDRLDRMREEQQLCRPRSEVAPANVRIPTSYSYAADVSEGGETD